MVKLGTFEDFKERYLNKFDSIQDKPSDDFILMIFLGLVVQAEINYDAMQPMKKKIRKSVKKGD